MIKKYIRGIQGVGAHTPGLCYHLLVLEYMVHQEWAKPQMGKLGSGGGGT